MCGEDTGQEPRVEGTRGDRLGERDRDMEGGRVTDTKRHRERRK